MAKRLTDFLPAGPYTATRLHSKAESPTILEYSFALYCPCVSNTVSRADHILSEQFLCTSSVDIYGKHRRTTLSISSSWNARILHLFRSLRVPVVDNLRLDILQPHHAPLRHTSFPRCSCSRPTVAYPVVSATSVVPTAATAATAQHVRRLLRVGLLV